VTDPVKVAIEHMVERAVTIAKQLKAGREQLAA
jgi:hypothetical protein